MTALVSNSKRRTVWHSGPPPAIGWWPASINRNFGPIRWWDGVSWSLPAYRGDPMWLVEQAAAAKEERSYRVWWRRRTWVSKRSEG